MNHAPLVHYLGSDQNIDGPTPRRRVSSNPYTGFLQREAESVAPKAILRQLRRSPTPPLTSPELEPEESQGNHERQRRPSLTSLASSSSSIKSFGSSLVQHKRDPNWKEPEPYEVLRAVERKDIMYLMEVRDRAFPLLVRMSGGITPLLHAMRLGQSHREVAIVLLGAFSRWVNHVEDEQMENPRTKMILKALRTNLKLAIDYGLTKTQGSDLTASFLQTSVYRDTWVVGQAANISLALRAGTEGRPVKTADSAVRKFATRELGRSDVLIATLEDYIANATADLLMMGAWSTASEILANDRVYKAFVERLDEHKNAIKFKLNRRLKWQLRVLTTVLGSGRSTTYRSKVELLAGELDEGDGV
ncbi:hypothetical protein C8J57DRAFT_1432781 [Mycena rebaudengoi]|nr:hypothetical protein C8J57DRAFT_1432781 [Mycena rebaudengoi]